MTLTFPTWASFCIWLPGYSRASESKSEFCPTFFISPSESELNSMRCGTGVHTHHESLSPAPPDQFPACRSGHPRYASDVAHTPAPQRSDTGHRSRRDDLRPDRLVPLFLGDTGAVGCACILLSLFNLVIFQYYEQRLNISRCPQCHTRNLHVRKYSKGLYKLYCPHCGLHSRWRTWRYFSDEA